MTRYTDHDLIASVDGLEGQSHEHRYSAYLIAQDGTMDDVLAVWAANRREARDVLTEYAARIVCLEPGSFRIVGLEREVDR